jgi:hypothetical protein
MERVSAWRKGDVLELCRPILKLWTRMLFGGAAGTSLLSPNSHSLHLPLCLPLAP